MTRPYLGELSHKRIETKGGMLHSWIVRAMYHTFPNHGRNMNACSSPNVAQHSADSYKGITQLPPSYPHLQWSRHYDILCNSHSARCMRCRYYFSASLRRALSSRSAFWAPGDITW